MCALLHIIENGYEWMALPKNKKYGNYHTIYVKFSRWSKSGTIAKIVEAMKKQKLLNEEDYILCIDNTSIKVSPDANKKAHLHVQLLFVSSLATFMMPCPLRKKVD